MYFIEDEKIARDLNSQFIGSKDYFPGDGGKENFQLTSSTLEYHDPTPNIHELFVLFDKRFFWGKLGMVEVKWSNRMTTCAGLCYYRSKSGLCSIKLSAPLLSLRPRKDLVETLLHEMIHAYLFVTQNFRDRDDHGPQFHKHMHRINKEAGTNITVYHTFHDEVSYYQKHIWRCNGPCQNRRPYFGFVKRAMNRAPGPNDYWWKEHQNNCGGTFIKVSEPEKKCKKKSSDKDKNMKSIKDIRNFFPSSSNTPSPIKENFSSNIHTIDDFKRDTKSNEYSLKVINQTSPISPKEEEKTDKNKMNEVSVKNEKDEFLRVRATVRNVWTGKYPSPKKTNVVPSISPISIKIEMKRREVNCPVCDRPYSETVINEHIDECLLKNESIEILYESPRNIGNEHSASQSCELWKKEDEKKSQVHCPVCTKALDSNDLQEHLELCLNFTFGNDDHFGKEDEKDYDSVPCPCCLKWVKEKSINDHIDECLTFIALKNSSKLD